MSLPTVLLVSLSIWHKNHDMAIVILHPILPGGHCISAREPQKSDGSSVDIQRPPANTG